MHRHAFAVLFLVAPALRAQGPPGYYNAVDASSAAQLRATLHAVIDDHVRFPYTAGATDTWDILEQAMQDPNNAGNIVDVYRNASYVKIGGGVGVYDREHSWPKSYGFPVDGPGNYPYTDCHQLFLCDSGYNSSRSNRPYATSSAAAAERPTLLTNGSGGGSGVYAGNSNWTDSVTAAGRWEAWQGRRGDVARALFYLDVRYEGGVHGVTQYWEPDLRLTDNLGLITASNTGSNEQVAYMGMLSTLLQWHAQDPVDQTERNRNDAVFGYQGNRNPFVDHPEWVACLFQAQCGDTLPPAAPTALIASTGKHRVDLDWADNVEPDLAGYRVERGTAPGGPFAQLTGSLVATSAYTDIGVLDGMLLFYRVRAVDSSGNVSAPSNTDLTRWPRYPTRQPATIVPQAQGGMWINELHYENAGIDVGEFVEIAGPAGTDLTGWMLVGYDGASGHAYSVRQLSGTVPSQQNGYGARAFTFLGLEDGSPDGVALVDAANHVVEFLSYEGTFTATDGPAAGMSSTAIPTSEDDSTPAGFSLQRQGTGHAGGAFAWSAPMPMTLGQPNSGQTLQ